MHAASPRRLPRVLLALVVLAGAALAICGPAPVADAAVPTSITVWVEPPTALEPYTPATFRASVTPADATGTVNFYFDGNVFGNATLVGGQAAFETASHPVGVHQLQAAFIPAPGSGFAPSSSSAVSVTVNDIARLLLSRGDGSLVPPGSQVRVGEKVTVSALGYPASSIVTFTLAGTKIPTTVSTNASGSGAASFVVPTSLPSAVYQLAGSAGLKSAGFVFYIYNPPAAPTPTPSATVPVSVPVSGGGGTAATPGATPTSGATSGTPGLANTGSDLAPLLAWASLALGLGSYLMVLGRPVGRVAARHARS